MLPSWLSNIRCLLPLHLGLYMISIYILLSWVEEADLPQTKNYWRILQIRFCLPEVVLRICWAHLFVELLCRVLYMLQGLLIATHPWHCNVEFCAYFLLAFHLGLYRISMQILVSWVEGIHFPTNKELYKIRCFLLEIAGRFCWTHHKVIWWIYLSVCWEFCADCLQYCDACWLLPTHAWLSIQ